jgi:hypothetical protein
MATIWDKPVRNLSKPNDTLKPPERVYQAAGMALVI